MVKHDHIYIYIIYIHDQIWSLLMVTVAWQVASWLGKRAFFVFFLFSYGLPSYAKASQNVRPRPRLVPRPLPGLQLLKRCALSFLPFLFFTPWGFFPQCTTRVASGAAQGRGEGEGGPRAWLRDGVRRGWGRGRAGAWGSLGGWLYWPLFTIVFGK